MYYYEGKNCMHEFQRILVLKYIFLLYFFHILFEVFSIMFLFSAIVLDK